MTTPLNTTNGVLSLVSLSADNEGNYKCVAFNGVGRSKEMDVLIKVQSKSHSSLIISIINSSQVLFSLSLNFVENSSFSKVDLFKTLGHRQLINFNCLLPLQF